MQWDCYQDIPAGINLYSVPSTSSAVDAGNFFEYETERYWVKDPEANWSYIHASTQRLDGV
jgi:hypothetical protein